MKESELKNRLTEELSDMAPNRLDDLLRACEDRVCAPRPVEAQPQRPRRSMPRILAAAAVFALLLGGILGYRGMDASRCIITIDVNPSVSLTVNRFDRVKEVTPQNADAQALLEEIDLQGARLRDALETLTATLVEDDYLGGTNNAMLVSVENASAERAEALCKKVVSWIEEAAQEKLFHSAVLYQRISGEKNLQSVAETLGVSVGKAALVDTLAARIEGCSIERLSTLSIQDLLFLADTQEITFENAELFGTVNRLGYQNSASAAKIAMENAGVSDADFMISFDGRDGELVYIIFFSDGTQTYRYTISAKGGTVLDVVRTGGEPEPEQNAVGGGTTQQDAKPQTQPEQGDMEDVLTHVLKFVQRTLDEIQDPDVELRWIDGRPVYVVSFRIDGRSYQFYVDARTSDIF